MKKHTHMGLTALFLFAALLLQAGDAKVKLTFGAEYELPKKHYDIGFIGDAARGYVQIGHAPGKSLSLQRFDKNLKLVSEQLITLKGLPKGYVTESWREVGDSYYWFYSTWDKKAQREHLFSQKINVEKGNLDGGPKEILEANKLSGTLTMTGFYNFSTQDKWNFTRSADKKVTLIQYRIVPKEKRDVKNTDLIGLHVYDENMNKIWGNEITMPYTEADMDNVDYQVDGKGNVYCLAKIYDDRKSKDKTKPNYHFEILLWKKGKTEVTKIPFKFEDKFVSSAILLEDYKGRVIVAGYYSKIFRSGASDGAFVLKVDLDEGKVSNVQKGIYEFPTELLKEFESQRTKKKIDKADAKGKDVEEASLTLRNVTINEDGTIQIFGEQYQVISYTYFDSKGVPHTRYTYYHLDIIALNIGKDGEIAWVKKIPKQQISGSPYGQGFSSFSYGTDKFFFFTDNPKNLSLSPSQAPVTHGSGVKGTVMAVRIDETGKMTKSVLYDAKDNKTFLNATDFDKVGENQLITRTAQKKVSRAMLLTFEKKD